MALSYAGVYLPLQTPDLERYLAQVNPRDLYRQFNAWNFESTDLTYLPTPVLPEQPPIRPGVLHWPTGACRPAWFHAVVGSDVLAQLRAACGDPRTPQNLVMSDGRNGKTITASMYMLPPIPLTQFGLIGDPFGSTPVAPQQDGWLITLTDQRFYWHWRRGVVSDTASWTSLFANIGSVLGASVSVDTVDSAYLTPSAKWKSNYQPAATILDAAAAQVGQVVVVSLAGAVRTVNWETAKTASDNYLFDPDSAPVISGGVLSDDDIDAYVPASVDVVFGGSPDYSPPPSSVYVVNKTLASLSVPGYGGATGVAGPAALVYADLVKTTTPDNTAQVDAYAAAAATDWYGWRLPDMDLVWPGIEPWVPTGFEDYAEWTYQRRDGQPFASTQIRLGPFSDFPSGGIPNPPAVEYRDKCIAGSLWRQKSTDGGYTWTDEINFETPCNVQPVSGSGTSGGSGSGSSASLQTIDVLCVGGILYVIRGRAVISLSNGQLSVSFSDLVWDTQGCCDCPAGSSGSPSTVTVACCPDPIPTTLTAVVSGGTGLDGTYSMTYVGSNTWAFTTQTGPFGTCPQDNPGVTALAVRCEEDGVTWSLFVDNLASGPFSPDVGFQCSPFNMTWSGITFTDCGGAVGATVTVTA